MRWRDRRTRWEGPTPPAVKASPHATQVQVFALGTDRSIWYDTYTNAGWDGWKSIGGVLTSGPAVATGQAKIDVTAVFAIGTDSAIWEKRYKGAWSAWLKVP